MRGASTSIVHPTPVFAGRVAAKSDVDQHQVAAGVVEGSTVTAGHVTAEDDVDQGVVTTVVEQPSTQAIRSASIRSTADDSEAIQHCGRDDVVGTDDVVDVVVVVSHRADVTAEDSEVSCPISLVAPDLVPFKAAINTYPIHQLEGCVAAGDMSRPVDPLCHPDLVAGGGRS